MAERLLSRSFLSDRRGATAIEYALIAGLIAVLIVAGVTLIGGKVGNTFNQVGGKVQNATGP